MTGSDMTPPQRPTRTLGHGLVVSAQGLGCMGMRGTVGRPLAGISGPVDERESIATIRCALDLGITLLDTADIYGLGENERLVGRAIAGRRDEVVLATKCGIMFGGEGGRSVGQDAHGVPVLLEPAAERLPDDLLVVDHQDARPLVRHR